MNVHSVRLGKEHPGMERVGIAERRGYKKTTHHITTQLQPVCGGAYGSSPFPTGPQTDGTFGSDQAMSRGEIGQHNAPGGL